MSVYIMPICSSYPNLINISALISSVVFMQNFRLSRNIIAIYKHKYPELAQTFHINLYIFSYDTELLDPGAIMIEFHKNTRLEMQIQSLGTYLWNTYLQRVSLKWYYWMVLFINFECAQFCNTASIINPVLVWAYLFQIVFKCFGFGKMLKNFIKHPPILTCLELFIL